MRDYFITVLLGIDQLINCLLSGDADESLSARAYRCSQLQPDPKRRWVFAHSFINLLFFFETEHCKLAFESEVKRRQFPKFYQENYNKTKEH